MGKAFGMRAKSLTLSPLSYYSTAVRSSTSRHCSDRYPQHCRALYIPRRLDLGWARYHQILVSLGGILLCSGVERDAHVVCGHDTRDSTCQGCDHRRTKRNRANEDLVALQASFGFNEPALCQQTNALTQYVRFWDEFEED